MPQADGVPPHHDRVHDAVDDPRWRESYYFSFFDERSGIGGFSSIGKRPARGHSGSINVLWGPGIPTLVASELDTIDAHDDRHLVAGMSYRAAAGPFGPWEIAFQGELNDGGARVECDHGALGATSRSAAPKTPVRYELTFTPGCGPYLYPDREEWRDLFTGHVDEIGAVTGEVEIDGRRHAIDGRGAKDHSWGVRDWFKPAAWRWADLVGPRERELALWRASFDGERWVEDGAVYGAAGPAPLTAYAETVRTVPRPGKPLPAGIEIRAEAGDARVRLEGEVVRVVPIIFSREVGGRRLVSWNDRALVRCELAGGERGWANVEFEEIQTAAAS